MRLLYLGVLFAGVAGCASTAPRAGDSTWGCMTQVRAQLPQDLSDARAHCLASAGIALQCSAGEAWLAGWGKELQDFFGRGDASLADLRADAAGRRCARERRDPATMAQCCESSGF